MYVSNVSKLVNNFQSLNETKQFQYIMSSENNDIIIATGNLYINAI